MQRVSVVIRVPGQPNMEMSVLAADARARHAARLLTTAGVSKVGAADTTAPPGSLRSTNPVSHTAKKRKVDSAVKSSVADRAHGPGTDPTSRFSYVYTGRHDHCTLDPEQERVASAKWSGISSALSEMKTRTDEYLTGVIDTK